MATDAPGSPQRAYRAACPNCGAPVEFRSAASPMAVCSFCRSTLVRDGEALQRIGTSAELFDDHSPLQLGVGGRYQGAAFTLAGRLQMRYAGGTWNEWHAVFDNGRSGWLSEDNGQYVFSFEAPAPGPLPAAETLRPGTQQVIGNQGWSVASVSAVKVGAAEGELPFVPELARGYVVADLRNTQGEVATLDYSDTPPRWYVGRGLRLEDLAASGLKTDSARELKGRSLECPNCGAALEVKLGTTQSITCHQCHAVVDVSQGVGAELAHYTQRNSGESGLEPQLPLGSTGTLSLGGAKAVSWQVVGYVERCEIPEDPEDEQVFWREYLLYHRTEGFAFLVDTEEGWSWTRPITGVPKTLGADRVSLEGVTYRRKYSYSAKITWVLGEFYWHLEREQRTFNTDYEGTGASARKQLNREQAGDEVTWSAGQTIPVDTVLKAFRIAPEAAGALQRDAGPVSASKSSALAYIFLGMLILLVLVAAVRCGSDDCDDVRRNFGEYSNEYQQCKRSGGSGVGSRGGSWGGFSSGGGGHK
ncbi:DUF4178 domain-containing protein [Methylibium rhizosphaerae]|uniref:DUF4178 domain-containing protein n=1 Tax=Methylibium rhizosphaerae TaxID=2570323 RepID=UPI0011298FA0|nr:DUF4178 domain-containing protein [Methylibium rhizosphaerae]